MGDWEVDNINGNGRRQVIESLTELKTGLALIHKVDRRTTQAVQEAVTNHLKLWISHAHTLTADNGKEFTGHQVLSRNFRTDFFFAHPYAA